MQQDKNYDTKIFSFAILLSSYFIYNSMSILDENALEAMSFVVQLTQHITSKMEHCTWLFCCCCYRCCYFALTTILAGHVSQYMPNFLWVLRDFALDLEDEEGNPITSNQYLERCLAERYVRRSTIATPIMCY